MNLKITNVFNTVLLPFGLFKGGIEYLLTTKIGKSSDKTEQILTILSHEVEKGLGHKYIKKGFGIRKVEKLCDTLYVYLKDGGGQNIFAVCESFQIIDAYIKYKDSQNENIIDIKRKYEQLSLLVDNERIYHCRVGPQKMAKEQLVINDKSEIKWIFNSCRSIRNYALADVVEDDIIESIRLASHAPSACNRQPVNVYYTMNKDKISVIDTILPGNSGMKGETPNFLIITSSIAHFRLTEYNQWYVNGGIFLGYLRIALHSMGMGNCIYQWTSACDEKTLRATAGIPKCEIIIAVVGIGYYDDISYCIAAQRKPVNEYIRKF